MNGYPQARHGWPYFAGFLIAVLTGPATPVSAQTVGPEVVQLRTGDGVQLVITYYASTSRPGTPAARQVTPVVMLHDHKDTRAIFGPLATLLQTPPQDDPMRASFAVVAIDLRGHGDSTKQIFGARGQQDLDAAKISKADVYSMAALDMEEVRRFLVTKNDEGVLNLNKLCLLGSGMGANVAANWAVEDWRVPPLAVGKQGQDVKALVMISPRWSFQGLSMQGPMRLRPLKEQAAWMLVYGSEEPEVVTDIRRIEKQLKPFHPDTDGDGAARPADFVVMAVPSKLQGDNLLTKLGDQVNDRILNFLIENVASKNLPWAARRTH
jgi:pimeloyl-ACP methyl ester carboxylesterase